MPFVRIDLRRGRSRQDLAAISRSIHQAMTETIDVPKEDYFQVVTQHDSEEFYYSPSYMDMARTDELVFIQITLTQGRPLGKEHALYARIVQLLNESVGLRTDDIMIVLVENAYENWSFGKGLPRPARSI